VVWDACLKGTYLKQENVPIPCNSSKSKFYCAWLTCPPRVQSQRSFNLGEKHNLQRLFGHNTVNVTTPTKTWVYVNVIPRSLLIPAHSESSSAMWRHKKVISKFLASRDVSSTGRWKIEEGVLESTDASFSAVDYRCLDTIAPNSTMINE
jgi:hypothetical protein